VTIVVPAGAEARAVRRSVPGALIVAPGAASARLPAFEAPDGVVVVGLCGSLRELRAGDVVVYRSIADAARTIELDTVRAAALAGALPGAHLVDAFTSDRVVTQRRERAQLALHYDADVVDMEGTHLAAALAARGVPFAMVRVVSDDAQRDLPPIGDAIDADGKLRPLRIALAFARAPGAAFAFVRDVRGALAVLTVVAAASAAVH
jgi:adenosylhomocysteine nucleosidase